MDIGQRIDVIKQGAELAQKSGALTLDDAYNAKVALMSIESNGPNMDAIDELIKTLEKGRTNGAYSFQDCYYIYIAINAQYHDYAPLFKTWFREGIEHKIIESAIVFWFCDVDYNGESKIDDYFNK